MIRKVPWYALLASGALPDLMRSLLGRRLCRGSLLEREETLPRKVAQDLSQEMDMHLNFAPSKSKQLRSSPASAKPNGHNFRGQANTLNVQVTL